MGWGAERSRASNQQWSSQSHPATCPPPPPPPPLAQVEREFEVLYDRHIKSRQLDEGAHRSMLMCCLSIATYRVLNGGCVAGAGRRAGGGPAHAATNLPCSLPVDCQLLTLCMRGSRQVEALRRRPGWVRVGTGRASSPLPPAQCTCSMQRRPRVG